MQLDRYTKTVLTVIAGSLVTLVAQNAIQPSIAQGDRVQRVTICEPTGIGCTGLPVQRAGTLSPAVAVVSMNR